MKVNKTYEEMIDIIIERQKPDESNMLIARMLKAHLLNNPTRRNRRIVKKVYRDRILYDAGFDIKIKRYKVKV